MARIGGLEVKAEGKAWAGQGGHQLDVWLARTGHEQEVRIEDELTIPGLLSRLEYMLDQVEVNLLGHRRPAEETAARIPAYEGRLGQAFAYEAELDAKEAELAGIEVSLVSDTGTTAATAWRRAEIPVA